MEKEKILNLVREYYRENHMRKEYEPGDRMPGGYMMKKNW